MKNLANCTLKEFVMQINRIRHEVKSLFDAADIKSIRSKMPKFTGEETEEEKAEIIRKQGKKNLSEILDNCLEKNVDLTVKVIGLCCFKNEEEAEKMEVSEFYDVVFELLGSKRVMDFFMRLANSDIPNMVLF
jgi:hypothetical protein